MLRHAPPFQLLFDFTEALLDLLIPLGLLPLALLLFVLVDGDKNADCFSRELIPRFPPRMGAYKHCDYIIFREFIFFKPLLPSAFIFLLVLCLKFLRAPTIITRKPSDIGKEIAKVGQKIFKSLASYLWKLSGLIIFSELEQSDDGDIVEIEGSINLDPL